MGIDVREDDGHGTQMAVLPRRTYVLDHARGFVVSGDGILARTRHPAAVNDVGMERVGRDVRVFGCADRVPLAEGDLAVVTAAGDACGAALLLTAIHPIGELIIGDDVIELRGRLVVPGTPGAPVIDAGGGALIECEQDDVGIQRIDPDGVIVVAAWRAFDRCKGLTAIGRSIGGGIGDVNDVLVLRIDANAGEIRATAGDSRLAVDAFPGAAGIVGTVHAGGFAGIHQGIHAIGIAWGHADSHSAESLRESRQTAGERMPGIAAIGGLVEATVRTAESSVLPGALPRLPENSIDVLRIVRIEGQVDGAGMLVLVEDFLPGLAAVRRAEDTALRVRAVGMPEHGDEESVWVPRIDQDRGDLLSLAKSEMAPGFSAIRALVDSVADGEVGALQALAAPHIDDIGVGGGERDGADGSGGLVVEGGVPGAAVVVGLPDAAVVDADVEDIGLIGDSGRADGTSSAERSDHAPLESGVELGIVTLREKRNAARQGKEKSPHR